MNKNINAIISIAYRDWLMLMRDKARLVTAFIFPALFIGVMGFSLQTSLGQSAGYNLLTFVFLGVVGQNLFQTTATGVISLIEDRESDFSQVLFIAPISHYTIIIGKIIGESLVALTQLVGIFLIAVVIQVPLGLYQIAKLLPSFVLICFLGGAFGTLVISRVSNRRLAGQLFTFLIFPQIFLSGVFAPINNLPPLLLIASRLSPLTYALDLIRGIYYEYSPESGFVLHPYFLNVLIITTLIIVFLVLGSFLFARRERHQ